MSESLAAFRDFVRASEPTVSWQHAIKRAIRTASDLYKHLELEPGCTTAGAMTEGEQQFPVFVPLEFLRRMRKRDPQDPLFLQVAPTPQESESADGFSKDPVGELVSQNEENFQAGWIQKYPGRALLIAHSACAVHCRYCFRRHFPYEAVSGAGDHWNKCIDLLQANDTIHEVILSGGDPLMLTDQSLRQFVDRIASVDHVRRLRLHTRLPIVIPQRITDALVQTLRGTRLATWTVVHSNHPNELDDETLTQLQRLVDAGIPVLNQAVLLKGVNDRFEPLFELFQKLIDARVQPYYLHHLDPVAGASHFAVDESVGKQLIARLRESLPGYAVPRYVREDAGASSKTPLGC